MSLIYKRKSNQPSHIHVFYDYLGEMKSFLSRVDKSYLLPLMLLLKSLEWGIYRWYKTPIRRFYGVKSNELIYMITNACNDRCPKCGIWKNPESPAQHLKVDYFLNCLRRLHHNLYQVTITGGEPLLFKNDVLRIAEEAKILKVPMVTITNARLLDNRFLTIYKKYEHILVISIDSIIKTKWNEFRGRDNFEIVMSKISIAKQILGDKLRIQSVLSKESASEIPRVIEWCNQNGLMHNIQLYQDFGADNWHHLDKQNGAELKNEQPCAARKNICIYPNGDVVKCFDHHRIPLAIEPIGNISKQDIIEILCTKRSTEISQVMKSCNFPCKNMSCNKPQAHLFNA